MTPQSEDDTVKRIIAGATCYARDKALDAAILLCEAMAVEGHSAECCARAIRDLKEKLSRAPSEAN